METVFFIGVIFSVVTSVLTNGCFSQYKRKDLTMCTNMLDSSSTTLYIETYNEALVNDEVKCSCELRSISTNTIVQVNILRVGKYSNYHIEVGGNDYTGKNTTGQFVLLKGNPSSIDFEISPIPTNKIDIPRLCLEITVKTAGEIKVVCEENLMTKTFKPTPVTIYPFTQQQDKYEVTQPADAKTEKSPSEDIKGVLIAVICSSVGAVVLLASAIVVTVVCKRRKTRLLEDRDMSKSKKVPCEIPLPVAAPACTSYNPARSNSEKESENLMKKPLYNCETTMSDSAQACTSFNFWEGGHDTDSVHIYVEIHENDDNAAGVDDTHLGELQPGIKEENMYITAVPEA